VVAKMSFKTFQEVESEVTRLYTAGNFEQAIALLESVMEQYPDNLYTITWDMAVLYSIMTPKQTEKSLDILEYGYNKGLWYAINPESKLWETCRDSARFKELEVKNKERREQVQVTSQSKYEVYLPEGYVEGQSYPLHIAIHGWGEDVPFFRKFWKSDELNKSCISLFVQSSRVASPIGFCWDDVELGRKEIMDAYEKVSAQYPIGKEDITVGGFSQGGAMAIDFALNEMIPVKGFIALCPDQPSNFSKEGVESMIKRNVKGIILTGEKDGSLPEQEAMIEVFKQTGFDYRFTINEGLGHWFPENLSEQMDDALDYIAPKAAAQA